MSSKRNVKRKAQQKTCGTKRPHDTLEAAQAHAWAHSKSFGGWMNPYACNFCGKYHIGHAPYRVRQSMTDRARNKRLAA